MRRVRTALVVLTALAVPWLVHGALLRAARAPRTPSPSGEMRGAWHVHTTRSDGRGTLDEVVAAAKRAGLQFIVVTDHNVLAPDDQGWHDGVLVIEATEVSTRDGHVVALGVPRALTVEERDSAPLRTIGALGGEAILAHPLHPRRPFTGWGRGPWRGFEIVSNDTAWHQVVARRDVGRAVRAALALPWDRARAVLALGDDTVAERARFDAELARAERQEDRRPARLVFCSADAHGYPSYLAAFEAFSMHVPVAPSGDAAVDVRAVVAALLDGRAVCVMDGVEPASAITVAPARGAAAFDVTVDAADLTRAKFVLLHDGSPVAVAKATVAAGRATVRLECPRVCERGDYRVEATWDGRPWIFTNPVTIE